jgi:hypothetical protein
VNEVWCQGDSVVVVVVESVPSQKVGSKNTVLRTVTLLLLAAAACNHMSNKVHSLSRRSNWSLRALTKAVAQSMTTHNYLS